MIRVICCSSLLSVPGRAGALSRDVTTSLAPECRAFSGALKIEKLTSPLIPGPKGAVDTNDWCIRISKKSQNRNFGQKLHFSSNNLNFTFFFGLNGSSQYLEYQFANQNKFRTP